MASILVVEDDTMVRDLLVKRLQWEGYRIVTASNGAQAVALTRTDKIDLVLMDIGLPILNGWQAAHRIRAHADTATLPIIALTAYALSDERLKCFEMGCDDYESKPFDFDHLLSKVQALLERVGAPIPQRARLS
jgi:two-component system cell cycle response regulator DivK